MTLDRATVLAGIADELAGFGQLVRSLDDQQLRSPTRCAGWTVADVAGHVIGTVVDVTERRLDGQGTPAVTQRQATERSGRSAGELADELAAATLTLIAMLSSPPAESWDKPARGDERYSRGFAVEAIWFDAYVHGDDIRAAIGATPVRGPGLRCAVHHVAGYLETRGWGPRTLTLEGIEPIEIAGGGAGVAGDPHTFILAATGRADPTKLGLDDSVNVYAD